MSKSQEEQLEEVNAIGSNIIVFTVDIGLMFPGIEHFEDKLYESALGGSVFIVIQILRISFVP